MAISKNKSKDLYGSRDILGTILSNWRNKKVLQYIRGKLVDLSCGDNRLVRAYGSGAGVDITNYGADIVLSDFLKLPFENSSIDTVTIIASLNYFDDPAKSIKEINRILKNDGCLILTMPNLWVMKIWHKFREPWAKQSGFSEKKIKKMTKEAGFKISQKNKFMLGVNNIYIFIKI